MSPTPAWLIPAFLLAGATYGAVGHGGASAYLALLTLAGVMSPEWVSFVLILNVIVAGSALYRFTRQGHLRRELLAPFAIASVPFAYLGGAVRLDPTVTGALLALALCAAGLRFLLLGRAAGRRWPPPPRPLALALGAVLGFVSGAVGIGGGVFLSPLLVLTGWADVKESAAVAAGFIVLNSIAGLLARFLSGPATGTGLPGALPLLSPDAIGLLAAAIIGGQIGAWAGAARLPKPALTRVLGVVLILAAVRHGWAVWAAAPGS
ncbi:MAG: sulfite exporter TauE/SafE family protein [Nitrospirae bacterium]|nr:sulfite exporter TauE/SafE family protein [Nitrospirota bacterium]